jgi:hypothetical protein
MKKRQTRKINTRQKKQIKKEILGKKLLEAWLKWQSVCLASAGP